ncbi:hypothetical protein JMJ55_27510 [Belnapia sp. T6]|uniref:Uncharacterized protein n=1 Tax=Belnapia mucosa TaxID=2804532 RepID=A0ABS1VBT1_9PROT|nr:hypothetical protein [Belnapia mucosa]MBL6459080.1 hypothetical protein [Belnapia mucosa]
MRKTQYLANPSQVRDLITHKMLTEYLIRPVIEFILQITLSSAHILLMCRVRLNPALHLDWGGKPACDDEGHRNSDVPGKEIRGAVVDDVEGLMTAENHLMPFGRKCPSRVPPGETEKRIMLKRYRGEGLGLKTAAAEEIPLEAKHSELCLSQTANSFTP